MTQCPKCNENNPENSKFCVYCGHKIQEPTEKRTQYKENLQHAFTLLTSTPILFIPEILAALFEETLTYSFTLLGDIFNIENLRHLFENQVTTVSSNTQDYSEYPPEFWYFGAGVFVLLFLYAIVSGFFTVTAVHMIWSGINNEEVSLMSSVKYVFSRLGHVLFALLIGTVFSVTIILIPAVVLMYVIMVVDGTGIREGLSKGFSISLQRLGISVLIVVMYLGLSFAFDYIPVVGNVLFAIPSTIITASLVDL